MCPTTQRAPMTTTVPRQKQCMCKTKKPGQTSSRMNTALANVFLEAMLAQVHASFQQRRLRKPNIVFVDLFLWFVKQYGTTMAKDREANRPYGC
jgi:hypothetical protein